MKSGLDYFLDQVRRLATTKPPYNAAFTTQALYLLNQSVTIIEGLNEIIRKNKLEIEKLKLELSGTRPLKAVTDPIRNAQILEDHHSGLSLRQIAKKHGITGPRVHQILSRLGATNGKARVKGLSGGSNTECEGAAEARQEAGHSSDANRVGQDGDGSSGDRIGAW